jgi:Domain of unknown function (DUF4391)
MTGTGARHRVKKLFVQQVEQIVWQFKLAPETINLPARPAVPEIQVFAIQLKTPELNHIAQLGNGALRRAAAERFIAEVRKALADEAPWKPINFPSNQEVLSWLDAFPDAAMQGLGMGDLSIKKEWEDLCAKYRMSRVRVWTLDDDLAGLDRAVLARRRVT